MRVRAERPPWYFSVVGGALYKASASSAAMVSEYVDSNRFESELEGLDCSLESVAVQLKEKHSMHCSDEEIDDPPQVDSNEDLSDHGQKEIPEEKEAVVQHLYIGRSPPMFTEMRVLHQPTGDDHLVMELGMNFHAADDMRAML
ncbi:hypothetical protein Vadar_011421 [Vaccinium darrowii]|uniref:Uncharacterized protein n=1 Tax=Vaccinium darrowii TaxID=229202 RepID=A0ACB7XZY9_9ERIC|nr:hypothetical protein Vadar_011421 [Vaccinium darrowii]